MVTWILNLQMNFIDCTKVLNKDFRQYCIVLLYENSLALKVKEYIF